MAEEGATRVLTDARARRLSWRVIVDALRNLTKSGSFDPHGRPWIEVSAHLTGYTTNQLRQAQRTYAVIETFVDQRKLPDHSLEWPMSNLEVISRIAKVDPAKAEQILTSSALRSLRELSRIYNGIQESEGSKVSPMSAGHRSARIFIEGMHETLSNPKFLRRLLPSDGVSGVPALKPWPGGHPLVHPDFVASYYSHGNLRFAAFEGLRFVGDVNLHAATKSATKAAVEASFFARYYWCLAEWTPIDKLKMMKDLLGLSNVGIISMANSTALMLSPSTGEPSPDRQSILIEDACLRRRLDIEAIPSFDQ